MPTFSSGLVTRQRLLRVLASETRIVEGEHCVETGHGDDIRVYLPGFWAVRPGVQPGILRRLAGF